MLLKSSHNNVKGARTMGATCVTNGITTGIASNHKKSKKSKKSMQKCTNITKHLKAPTNTYKDNVATIKVETKRMASKSTQCDENKIKAARHSSNTADPSKRAKRT